MIRCSLALLFLLLFPTILSPASSITLAWDAATCDPALCTGGEVVNYRIYHSMTSGVYSASDMISVGTATQYTWTRSLGRGRHCFICRAFVTVNGAVTESENSNEITRSLLPPTGGSGKVNP